MKRALIVIDVQNEYFKGKLPISYPEHSFDNILSAIIAANQADMPVILIRHIAEDENSPVFNRNSELSLIKSEVLDLEYYKIVEKKLPSSFAGTELEAILKELNIDTLTICGYMTQMCCDTTARAAFHLGYKVEFLSDATGTLNITNKLGAIDAESLHKAILIVQNSRFSEVIATNEFLDRI